MRNELIDYLLKQHVLQSSAININTSVLEHWHKKEVTETLSNSLRLLKNASNELLQEHHELFNGLLINDLDELTELAEDSALAALLYLGLSVRTCIQLIFSIVQLHQNVLLPINNRTEEMEKLSTTLSTYLMDKHFVTDPDGRWMPVLKPDPLLSAQVPLRSLLAYRQAK